MLDLAVHSPAQVGGYREWIPAGPLARYCEAVWSYEANDTPSPHRLLPDNKPSLILYFHHDSQGKSSDYRLLVSGSRVRAAWYYPRPGDRQIALRLYPELAAECAAISPRDYHDVSIAAPDCILSRFSRLMDAADILSPSEAAQQLIAGFLALIKDVDERAEHRAAALIRQAGGQISVSGLADQLGLGERQLRRRFEAVMGLTPKAYCRLIRHLNAMRLADAASDPDWADIACASGYFDQSHMIREIRSLTGISPASLHAERRAESGISNTP